MSCNMRKTTDEQNNRLSAGFFSRLTSSRRKQQDPTEVDLNSRDLFREEEEADRQYLIQEVTQELRPQHPLSYDALCASALE